QSIARIVTWAEYVGRQSVRFETRRDPEGFFRKFGFQAISTVMELRITEESEEDIIERLLKIKLQKAGENHGKLSTEDSEHVDETSTVDLSEPQLFSESTDRTTSDAVRRTTSGSVSSSVRSGSGAVESVQPSDVQSTDASISELFTERERTDV